MSRKMDKPARLKIFAFAYDVTRGDVLGRFERI
jgi:hypothetical protein